MITSVLFFLFATILIFSAFRVITAKNPVHSVLYLVLSFVTSSCLWLILNAEFLALSLILIYVGAVMVLFLFIVMMLDINIENLRSSFWKNLPTTIIVGLVILVEMIIIILRNKDNIDINNNTDNMLPILNNSTEIGLLMYNKYSLPIELASILLLLGLVVAVALTLRKTIKGGKYQKISEQVNVNAKDRLKMIKMDSVIEQNDNEIEKEK